jgi:serine/threonine protein kinase
METNDDPMLSQHLCTRWYRPPEIITLAPNYNQKVDIWGLGCIIAEVAYMWDNIDGAIAEDRFLFKGGSCHPLSPITILNYR